MDPLTEYKQGARITWATGDYDRMARTEGLYGTGQLLVRTAGVTSADDVLDVACGTGNSTLPAAATGANVTGLDLAPEMLAAAANAWPTLAAPSGGGRATLNSSRSTTAVSTSCCRRSAPCSHPATRSSPTSSPGSAPGRPAGHDNWAPDGSIAEFFATVMAWPAHARLRRPAAAVGRRGAPAELFEGPGSISEFQGHEVVFARPVDNRRGGAVLDDLGPVAQTRQALEAEGRWAALASTSLRSSSATTHQRWQPRLAGPLPGRVGRKHT